MSAISWIGSASGFWDVASNWSSDPALPGPTDTVTIDVPGTGTVTYRTGTDVIASLSISGLTGGTDNFAVTGGSLTISGGFSSTTDTTLSSGTLSVGGTSILAAFSQSGGLLTGSGTVTVTSVANLSSGTESGGGTTVAQDGAALTTTSFGLDGGRVLELQGTSTATGNYVYLQLNNGGDPGSGTVQIDAGAVLDDQTTSSGFRIETQNEGGPDNGASALFDNLGTFQKSGDSTNTNIGVTFENSGTFDVEDGELTLSGTATNTGTYLLATGALLVLQDGFTDSGSIQTAAGSTFQIASGVNNFNAGTATIDGTFLLSSGTVIAAAGAMLGPIATLTQTGGLLTGTGVVTVSDVANLSGGVESGTGTTVAQQGVAFTTTSFGLDGGRVLELQGTSTATGNNVYLQLNDGSDPGSGTLQIDAGALLDDQTTSSGFRIETQNEGGADNGASAQFDNLGTFQKSGDSTNFNIGVTFDNSGTLDVEDGELTLSGTATNTGTYLIAAGALLVLQDGFTDNGAIQTAAGSTFQIASGVNDF